MAHQAVQADERPHPAAGEKEYAEDVDDESRLGCRKYETFSLVGDGMHYHVFHDDETGYTGRRRLHSEVN